MRKYEHYVLATEFGEETYFKYKEAFGAFQKADSATLYGFSEDGDASVIRSK